jgi:hypothetical protein
LAKCSNTAIIKILFPFIFFPRPFNNSEGEKETGRTLATLHVLNGVTKLGSSVFSFRVPFVRQLQFVSKMSGGGDLSAFAKEEVVPDVVPKAPAAVATVEFANGAKVTY